MDNPDFFKLAEGQKIPLFPLFLQFPYLGVLVVERLETRVSAVGGQSDGEKVVVAQLYPRHLRIKGKHNPQGKLGWNFSVKRLDELRMDKQSLTWSMNLRMTDGRNRVIWLIELL